MVKVLAAAGFLHDLLKQNYVLKFLEVVPSTVLGSGGI